MSAKTPYTRKDFERDTGIKLKPSDTIYIVQRSVSASGMSRQLDLYVMRSGDLRRITYAAAKLVGWTYRRTTDTATISGCGMDMHFAAVDALT